MKRVLLAACLAAGMAAPSLAETPPTETPPTETPPAGTGAAPPPAQAIPADTGAPPAAEADAIKERQRNSAAKLGGMVTFVSASCPEAKPDFMKFKQVISAMGVDIKELEQGGPLMVRLAGYVQAYQKDAAQSCRRALELFGPTGTTIPGLIALRPPEDRQP